MSLHTSIEWADSSINPVMGCDGCELWDPAKGIRICYAGQIHEMRAGNPGYADAFLEPKMFAGRMTAAARWRDLRGTARPDKPWLNDRARHVFISDMGDALSRDVPLEFLRDEVVRVVAGWPHVGMWLTKVPQRMAELAAWLAAQGIPWPRNLWVGTSITGPGQGARVRHIKRVGAATTFLSVEPVLRNPGELDLAGVQLVIIGGESGPKAGSTDLADLRALLEQTRMAGAAPFLKQVGTNARSGLRTDTTGELGPALLGGTVLLRLRDRKGGDPAEWPEDLRIREFPTPGAR